ncbi:hypothetical protein WJX75_001135 [Coccomyxa subellipsoidea]|uniref:Nucleolus and neural progenitor protein-like N-terminal domain-containing protein n=1 Tax=Coccomyxa subellipsoidea TaxID=248742 RepID=A0ABR2YEJ5_9CHLO
MIPVNFALLQGSLTRPDLVREMAYLERLLYKNKQQHRTSGHFQQLIDVHRCLQLWRRLDLPRSIAELAGHAKVTENAREAQWLPMSQQQTSQPSGQLLLQQIVAGCRVMGMVQAAVHKAASSLSAQLALSFFVPLCLTALAILARVRVLAGQWVLDAVAAYNELIDYLPTLPQEIRDTGSELPQLLKAEWQGSLPLAVQLSYEAGDSYAKRVSEHAASRPPQLVNSAVPDNRGKAPELRTDVRQQQQQRSGVANRLLSGQIARAQRPADKQQGYPAHLAVFEDRKAGPDLHSTEPDVPLYVPSGALGSAAPPLGISDALVLPGSKAGQKRARQAAAAAARQQQHQQLPAKRSWEEWLQPGASGAPAQVQDPFVASRQQPAHDSRGGRGSGMQSRGRGGRRPPAKKRR